VTTVRCVDCRFSTWQRTAAGRFKKNESGRCNAEIELPVILCHPLPLRLHKNAIWPNYEGRCDAFESIQEVKP
jgi:hypothetical protein